MFEHLSNPEYLHTLLNPPPAHGLAVGVLGLLIALRSRTRAARVMNNRSQLPGGCFVLATTALVLLTGCALTPPPVSISPNDPSNPKAAEAASQPLRPRLVSGATTYLSPETGADAQRMRHAAHDMIEMKDMMDYTCPMHPEVHRDTPGKCPKCGMTLVPAKKSAEEKP